MHPLMQEAPLLSALSVVITENVFETDSQAMWEGLKISSSIGGKEAIAF